MYVYTYIVHVCVYIYMHIYLSSIILFMCVVENELRVYTMRFAWNVIRVLPRLQRDACRQPAKCPDGLDIHQVFASLDQDLWLDAGMDSVLCYLKGNKALNVPADWRPWLPTVI